jgi:hypothetical protein
LVIIGKQRRTGSSVWRPIFRAVGRSNTSQFSLLVGIPATDTIGVDLDSFGTARARVGYIVNNSNLWYITGGYAYAGPNWHFQLKTQLWLALSPAASPTRRCRVGRSAAGSNRACSATGRPRSNISMSISAGSAVRQRPSFPLTHQYHSSSPARIFATISCAAASTTNSEFRNSKIFVATSS